MNFVFYPILALLLGAAGFALRRWQLATCFDLDGLPAFGPARVALAALFVGTALLFLLLSSRCARGEMTLPKAMRNGGMLRLSGLSYGAAAVLLLLHVRDAGYDESSVFGAANVVLPMLLVALCAVAAVCALLLPGWRGKGGPLTAAPALLCLAGCFWLIESYHAHANDPVTAGYIWPVMAAASAMMGWRYTCALAYGPAKEQRILFWSLLTIMLCTTALADDGLLWQRVLLLGQIWWFGWQTALLLVQNRTAGRGETS